MKQHKYLNIPQLKSLWSIYNEDFSIQRVARDLNIANSTASRWVRDIQHCLSGGRVTRVHGGDTLRSLISYLKRSQEESNLVPNVESRPASPIYKERYEQATESVEGRVNRLFEELKSAISDLALEIVETKNKELVDAAKKSNLTGFINSRLKS